MFSKKDELVAEKCLYFVICHYFVTKAALCDILAFATGANKIPPMGFSPQPTICFWEDSRPKANTCGNVLFLPTNMNVLGDYDMCQTMMDDGIMNSPCFGMA